MDELAKISKKAYNYLIELDPRSWARSWYPHTADCEHINSNFSESFNAMCHNIKDKPVCVMAIMYTQLVMNLYARRSALAATWNESDLVPAAMKLIKKMQLGVGNYDTEPSSEMRVYEVTNKTSKAVFTVDIVKKTCTCVQWKLRGFMCQHVVCVLDPYNPDWSEYCSKYYTVKSYRTTYSWLITPLGHIDDWPEATSPKIIHPELHRSAGRPCVNRKKSYMKV